MREFVAKHEAAAVGREAGDGEAHANLLQEFDLAVVLDLVLHDHRAYLHAQHVVGGEAVLGEIHHAHVRRAIEIRGVRHVRVVVHVAPAGDQHLLEHVSYFNGE